MLTSIFQNLKSNSIVFGLLFLLVGFPSISCIAQDEGDDGKVYTSTKSQKAMQLYVESTSFMYQKRYEDVEKLLLKALKHDSAYIDAYMRLSAAYRALEKPAFEEQVYRDVIRIRPDFPYAYFNYGVLLMSQEKYDHAEERFAQYLYVQLTPDKLTDKAKLNIRTCRFRSFMMQHPVEFKFVNIGYGINSELDEYWPVLTADDQILYFTRKLVKSEDKRLGMNRFNEDVFYSVYENDQWSTAESVPGFMNSDQNEGALSITPDGNTMYFTICADKSDRPDFIGWCDIYFSEFKNGKWTYPRNLGAPINTDAKETQPSISFDGKTLFYSSNRPGTQGKLDIWKSTKNNDGSWGEPVNLGKKINTPQNEESPFIHADDQSLYFSSDGHMGMGGTDLYMTKRMPDLMYDSVRNLGYPINDSKNQRSLFINSSGNKAYFSSGREEQENGMDIYCFDIPKEIKPDPVCYLKGTVFDAKSKARLGASFQLIDIETGKTIIQSVTEEGIGKFLVAVPSNTNYVVNVSKNGYLFYSDHLQIKGIKSSAYEKDIPLQPIEIGQRIVLYNIFFAFDSASLKPESVIELTKVIDFLNKYPNVKVEIGGHTDDQGTPAYNLTLSQKRAETVFNYLINTGKISKERLTFKGYGKSQLLTNDTSEKGRALNRRTEFKITGM
jgi:outer membrane protein OmpA-like peptidoglycan-associated protein/tetratricopeptide (TPR) repeat protein